MEHKRFLPLFAIMVKYRHEKAVAAALAGKGYAQYLPLQRFVRKYQGHCREVELPLFPSYVFARFDPEYRLPILSIPGVFSIVGNGIRPLPVEESEFESIRRLCETGIETEEAAPCEVGNRVVVMEGPLEGVMGTLISSTNHRRLVVAVTLLNRAVSVEIDAVSVRPLTVRNSLYIAGSNPAMTAVAAQ